MSYIPLPSFLLLAWLALAAGLLFAWRRSLLALWREPAFKMPILIVESDDWGAGPPAQAEALYAIRACLERHHDATGRPAVMTLALILATPKPGMVGFVSLMDASQQATLAAIRSGQERGVFALQLHGMLHFWPHALQAAALDQAWVRAWLDYPDVTERLPSPLQSRWIDASTLPSRPHAPEEIQAAVKEEVETFRNLFGAGTPVGAALAAIHPGGWAESFAPEGAPTPLVVVPPTFVWTREVEAAWAAQGVDVVITPGHRFTCRDAAGKPSCQDRAMVNGERGEGDVLYLVRDEYFEPLFGHRPEQALAALARKTWLGRPCLLETHRCNFLAETGGNLSSALIALDTLYAIALRDYPMLRFASCSELGQAIRAYDTHWIEQDGRRRFTLWLRRAALLPRFGKAARLAGLLPLLKLFALRDGYP